MRTPVVLSHKPQPGLVLLGLPYLPGRNRDVSATGVRDGEGKDLTVVEWGKDYRKEVKDTSRLWGPGPHGPSTGGEGPECASRPTVFGLHFHPLSVYVHLASVS